MKTAPALAYALAIALACCIMLIISGNMPPTNIIKDAPVMFLVGFVIMKLSKN